MTRMMFGGEPFDGKTQDVDLDVVTETHGQWVTGLEELNLSATSTAVRSSYAHTAFTNDQVSILLESFANVGSLNVVNIDKYKFEKERATTVQAIGGAAYGYGTANQMLGLEAIVDDGTNNASIGGISRSTYPSLKAYIGTVTANKLTLSLLDTMHDNCRAAGMKTEWPNVGYTTKSIWSLYGQLLQPSVRQSYREVGYDDLPLTERWGQRSDKTLRMGSGWTGLTYRTMTIVDDDFANQNNNNPFYMVNESYIKWHGRNVVPDEYKDTIEHVDFGDGSAYEGTGAMAVDELPSEAHGWFYQKPQPMPTQGGKYARFWVLGNLICHSFRRQAKATGITTN
ncbi:MAG TPA: hypothetical protein VF941_02915 [Clostridia bacterium]